MVWGSRIVRHHAVRDEWRSARAAAPRTGSPLFRRGKRELPKDPVKTVTVRKTLEKSGVAIKVKVPVDEFVGVAVSTHISE